MTRVFSLINHLVKTGEVRGVVIEFFNHQPRLLIFVDDVFSDGAGRVTENCFLWLENNGEHFDFSIHDADGISDYDNGNSLLLVF